MLPFTNEASPATLRLLLLLSHALELGLWPWWSCQCLGRTVHWRSSCLPVLLQNLLCCLLSSRYLLSIKHCPNAKNELKQSAHFFVDQWADYFTCFMNWKACRHSRCAKRWGLSVCSVDVYVLREYAFCKRELSLKGAVLLPWKRGKNNEKLNLNPQSPNSSLSQSLCSFSRSSNLWLGDFDHTPGYDTCPLCQCKRKT